jgi:type IV fimbrial biogenesis protein FimT
MKRTSLGLSLLDLIIALAISSILTGFGIPTLLDLISNSKANSQYQKLFTLIQYTRNESVNHGTQVLVCPTENQIDCVNNWNLPLMVFVDSNYDEVRNEEEMILRQTEALSNDERLTWRASGSRRYLRFKYDGATRNQNGRFTYCYTRDDKVYAEEIVMFMSGRARRGDREVAAIRCQAG